MKSQNRKQVSLAGVAGKKASDPNATAHTPLTTRPQNPRTAKPGREAQARSPSPKPATRTPFLIVGIGASAGGLEAFTDLLKHLPQDTGMGFVLVQHLDPQHQSVLPQLLARVTSLPVLEVTNNLPIEPNHVYAIPPNTSLAVVQGILKLRPRQQTRTPARSIDAFFESLAQDQRERAIGVVLSGTASDGTVGLEAIKAEGGITFAQDDSARYDSMPRSAVAAGCVDFVLKPEDIANELTRIAKHPYVAGRPREALKDSRASTTAPRHGQTPLRSGDPGRGADRVAPRGPHAEELTHPGLGGENGFKKILLLLRNHSGVDFSLYKSTTIQRRITRRMVLSKHDTLEAYAAFLRSNGKELDALYSDVLISVTSFFRNPEAFEVLKRQVFPRLLQRRSDEPVRVWVLGCSTGQEAYSIAMTFVEAAEKVSRARKLQVFATDLNEALLDKARHGLYAKTLVEDVSPGRLRRFLVQEEGGYRVVKPLREAVVFARQNLISDPPFSRIDLISCRNLLIYLEPGLHKKAMSAFHYALKPGGYLFLGASESIGNFTDRFEPADKRHKIYIKKPAAAQSLQLPLKKDPAERPPARRKPARPTRQHPPDQPEGFPIELNAQREADRVTVNHFAPPGVLINADRQILQFRGPTSPYLQPPSTGKATFDLLKMAREGLMLPLRAAINKARKENKTVRKENVRVHDSGKTRRVNLEVIPLKNLRERCFLILFEDTERVPRALPGAPPEHLQPPAGKKETAHRLHALETELSETRDYLQSIQEQHEAATEELQASSEEVQSANEELQSINEELETSKEELESANEELTTVNEEMANHNAELNRLNADLTNLQTSTKLPILLLGRDLTVRRFNAPAEKIFNLLATDVGRSLAGVRHSLVVSEAGRTEAGSVTPRAAGAPPFPVEDLAREVIDTVHEQQREVRDQDGRCYSLRVRPYFTVDNKVDGAILVLVDITELKAAQAELKDARDYAEAAIRTVPVPVLILRADLRVNTANEVFYQTFKTSPGQTEGRLIFDLGDRQWDIPGLRVLLEDILPRNSFFTNFEVTHDFPDLGRRNMVLNARRLDRDDGAPQMILLVIEDVTERQRAAEATSQLAAIVQASEDAIFSKTLDGRITSWNPGAERLFGYAAKEIVGKNFSLLLAPAYQDDPKRLVEHLRRGERVTNFETEGLRKDGSAVFILLSASAVRDGAGQLAGASLIARDITERTRMEQSLRQAQAQLADRAGQLEQAVSQRTRELTETNNQLEAFIYSIAHDLRAPLRAMQGFSSLLLQEAGPALGEPGQSYAQRINKSAQFMDAMLSDMLAYSRINQQRLDLAPVDLDNVILTVLQRLEQDIREKNARVEAPGPWPVVLAHQPVLEQVLFNLVSNALKFVPSGTQPLVRLRAEVIAPDPASPQPSPPNSPLVRVWVEDNGIGIAPAHQGQIFRLFTRLHGDRFPGTGIGLAIVEKGVERMGGTVGVESTPGQGSRFWIDLRTPPAF